MTRQRGARLSEADGSSAPPLQTLASSDGRAAEERAARGTAVGQNHTCCTGLAVLRRPLDEAEETDIQR